MGATKQGIDLIGSENEFADSADMNLSKFGEIVKDRESCCTAVHGVTKIEHDFATEQHLSDLIYVDMTHAMCKKGCKSSQMLETRYI